MDCPSPLTVGEALDSPGEAAQMGPFRPVPPEPRSIEYGLAHAGLGAWRIELGDAAMTCSVQCCAHLRLFDAASITPDALLGEDIASFTARLCATNVREPFQLERRVASPDGDRWVLIQGAGHYEVDGRMYALSGFTLDVTAQKNQELTLHERVATERLARERSDSLAATMDQFVMSVSHELRAPLNAIVTWAEVLALTTSAADRERAVDSIKRNGRQLSHMVDDLLDSGAITTGKLSVQRDPIDLRALVRSVAEDMHKQAQHKHIELRIGALSPCSIMGDESRMKQVVWNLLSNALKFTDAGNVDISLRIVDEQAEITVRDTGRGISADALPLVFDRFRQIAPRSSGRVGGLGLGLWLVKHIVALHEGTVSARSEGPGRGATFVVRVPCAMRDKTGDSGTS